MVMIQPVVIFFIVAGSIFAAVHWVAVEASLYWHYWWFDILMHFWGGTLIALGVVSLTSFRSVKYVASYKLVFLVALVIVITWEFFEWQIGLFTPALQWPDALYDVMLGLTGGLLGYWALRGRKI
jgi:hypothetical protein